MSLLARLAHQPAVASATPAEPRIEPVPGCDTCRIHDNALQTETVKRSWARHVAEDHRPASEPAWLRYSRSRPRGLAKDYSGALR